MQQFTSATVNRPGILARPIVPLLGEPGGRRTRIKGSTVGVGRPGTQRVIDVTADKMINPNVIELTSFSYLGHSFSLWTKTCIRSANRKSSNVRDQKENRK